MYVLLNHCVYCVSDVGSWREGGGRGAMQQHPPAPEEGETAAVAEKVEGGDVPGPTPAEGTVAPPQMAGMGPHPGGPRPGMPPMGPGGPMMFRGMIPPYVCDILMA